MMVIIGAIIVIGVIYLLLKRHESRMVLIAAGILMAVIAGKPMAALDAFAKSMTNAGLITSVCSCMGFAMVMKYTGCDKHLVVAIGKVLKKMGFMLIPGATIATFIINIAIPSAAGCSAAVGVIFIPILMSAGIPPAVGGGQPQHRGQCQNYSDKQQIFSFLGHGSLSNSSSSVRPSYPATAAGYAVRAAARPGAGSVTAAL